MHNSPTTSLYYLLTIALHQFTVNFLLVEYNPFIQMLTSLSAQQHMSLLGE